MHAQAQKKERKRGCRRVPVVRAGGPSRNPNMKKVRGCLFPFQTLPVPNGRGNLQSGSLQMCRGAKRV